MKTHDILRDGMLFAFEVENTFLGRHGAVRIIRRIPGVKILRKQRRFQISSEESFLEFELQGELFKVSEDWNDSNRYWIGPRSLELSPSTEKIREAFLAAKMFGFF